jgi:hypothetical protein
MCVSGSAGRKFSGACLQLATRQRPPLSEHNNPALARAHSTVCTLSITYLPILAVPRSALASPVDAISLSCAQYVTAVTNLRCLQTAEGLLHAQQVMFAGCWNEMPWMCRQEGGLHQGGYNDSPVDSHVASTLGTSMSFSRP